MQCWFAQHTKAIASQATKGLVDHINVTHGIINITPKAQSGITAKDTLILTPTLGDGHLSWAISGGAKDSGLVG